MTHKTNLSLLATLQADRRAYEKYALKVCRGNQENAEDILSNVIFKLLRKDITFEVENNKNFLFTMITQMNFNHWRVNRRYFAIGDMHSPDVDANSYLDGLMQRKQPCTFEGDIIDSLKLKSIKKAARSLPKNQRHAIDQALAGETVGAEIEGVTKNPRYESLKTNKRLAILKLKDQLA